MSLPIDAAPCREVALTMPQIILIRVVLHSTLGPSRGQYFATADSQINALERLNNLKRRSWVRPLTVIIGSTVPPGRCETKKSSIIYVPATKAQAKSGLLRQDRAGLITESVRGRIKRCISVLHTYPVAQQIQTIYRPHHTWSRSS